MRQEQAWVFSATDLVDALECSHRSSLVLARAAGLPGAPQPGKGPSPVVLEHGQRHEARYLERLRSGLGRHLVEIADPGFTHANLVAAAEQTRRAFAEGKHAVYQAVFYDGEFYGRADFVIATHIDPGTGKARKGVPAGRYEPYDTKLARHAKPSAVLQLAAYADALARSGVPTGEQIHLILGNDEKVSLDVADYHPMLIEVRERLRRQLTQPVALPSVLHADHREACGTCKFAEHCKTGREGVRDLVLVANLRGDQRRKLLAAGLPTIDALAAAAPQDRPAAVVASSWDTLHAQATLQVRQDATRTASDPTGTVFSEVFDQQALSLMPDPAEGDIYFDMEGNPFGFDGRGLEYLFGAVILPGDSQPAPGAPQERDQGVPAENFIAFWAHDVAQEKRAFEEFIDFTLARLALFPDAHVWHYASYEVTALKRLSTQHATRESEVRQLLDEGRLVDLYAVVGKSLRVSQRSYSIKYLEPLYMPTSRSGEVTTAMGSVEVYEDYLALLRIDTKQAREQAAQLLLNIADYNAYDCISTHRLHRFLQAKLVEARQVHPLPPAVDLRSDQERQEAELREQEQDDKRAAAHDALELLRVTVEEPLRAGISADPTVRTPEENARCILASAVGYYRREESQAWGDFFTADQLTEQELDTRSDCLVPVSFVAEPWEAPTGRQRNFRRTVFAEVGPDQVHTFSADNELQLLYRQGGQMPVLSKVDVKTVTDDRIELLESVPPALKDALGTPTALVPGPPVAAKAKAESVLEQAEQAVALLPGSPGGAGFALLMRTGPTLSTGAPLAAAHGDDVLPAVLHAAAHLQDSYLAVQGPPGAGKTYLAGELIAHLVGLGLSVGVCANSHKAAENALAAASGKRPADHPEGAPWVSRVPAAKVPKTPTPAGQVLELEAAHGWSPVKNPAALQDFRALHTTGHVVAGTAWNFASENFAENPVDVLIIDEAGQFALVDALAVSRGARNLVLLGDPAQLPQVTQASHPDGAGLSALEHLLEGAATLPPKHGYFLNITRRMHPALCQVVSQLSYQGKLDAFSATAERGVSGLEAGLYRLDVPSVGCTTRNRAEVLATVAVVKDLLSRECQDGSSSVPMEESNVLVVAPYNVQVGLLRRAFDAEGLAGVQVGTVDHFQGQEARAVVVSLTASAEEGVARGLEFLLMRNRLNVAISRAQAVAVLVSSPGLVTGSATTVAMLRLLSGLAGLRQSATVWPA